MGGCLVAYLTHSPLRPPEPTAGLPAAQRATARPAREHLPETASFARSHRSLQQAEQALADGDLPSARFWLELAAVPQGETSFRAFRASALNARLALAENRPELAVAAAATAAGLATDAAVLQAGLLLGDALASSGRVAEALEAWLSAATSSAVAYRGDLWDDLADRLWRASASLPLESPEARTRLMRAGRALYRLGRFAEGVALFSRGGWQERQPEAAVELARGLAATGQRSRRLEVLREALAEGEARGWPAATLGSLRLQLADEWLNRGEVPRAGEQYAAVLRDLPGTVAAGEALYGLVRIDLEAGRPALARERVEAFGPAATATPGWRDALLAIFAAAYTSGDRPNGAPAPLADPDTARWALGTLARAAGSDPAYLYWQARLLDEGGARTGGEPPSEPEAAALETVEALLARLHRLHPLSYYAALARRRWPAVAPSPHQAPEPDPASTAALPDPPGQLLEEGLVYEAAMELRYRLGEEPSAERAATLAILELRSGQYAAALGRLNRLAAGESRAGGLPPRWMLEALFPRPYPALVESEARRFGLDPLLLYAVMREESAFEPRARSASSAFGLMQLLPSTAGWMAGREGEPAPPLQGLFDPAVNIRLGAAYLRFLLERFPEPALAVAAYHAGPGRVSRWLSATGMEDGERFVEWIPIAATRNYVQKVIRSYEAYRLLYGPPSVRLQAR